MILSDHFIKVVGFILLSIGSIYGAWKVVGVYIKQYISKQYYLYTNGFHIMNDIQRAFGVDAGEVIIRFMSAYNDHKIETNMRLDILEKDANIGIYVCAASGECIYANSTLAKMLDMDEKDVLGFGWTKNIVDGVNEYKKWKFAVENHINYESTYDVRTRDGIKSRYTAAESKKSQDGVILGYVGIVKPA